MNLTMPLLVATDIFGGSASAGAEMTRKATTEESIFTLYCFSDVAIKLPDVVSQYYDLSTADADPSNRFRGKSPSSASRRGGQPQAARAGSSAGTDRSTVNCDHDKVSAHSGPALLFQLFYQVEIRRRQLPQRQSCTGSQAPIQLEYDASVAIGRFRCCGSSLPSARLLDEIGTRPRDPMTTVIGALKVARGFVAAHSPCTTETIANCLCVRP